MDSVNERTPKLKDGLNLLEKIENEAVSLESRLVTLSMNLVGAGVKETETMSSENAISDDDNTDRLGKVIRKAHSILKILMSAEESLAEIEKEI